MNIPDPVQVIWDSEESLDAALAALENIAVVYRIETKQGQVLLGRTNVLRRRLVRLLGNREQSSRALWMRNLASSFSYWPAVSRLESSLIFYSLARGHFPDSYKKLHKIHKGRIFLLFHVLFAIFKVTIVQFGEAHVDFVLFGAYFLF